MRQPRIWTSYLREQVWCVTLEGNHDFASLKSLRAKLEPTLKQAAPVIVDLTAATFDASIVGELIFNQTAAEAAAREGIVGVVPPGTPSEQLLAGAPASTLIPIFQTRTDAITWCGMHSRRPEAQRSGRPIAQLARDSGVHKEALRHRVRQAEADSVPVPSRVLPSEVAQELSSLRRENAEFSRPRAWPPARLR